MNKYYPIILYVLALLLYAVSLSNGPISDDYAISKTFFPQNSIFQITHIPLRSTLYQVIYRIAGFSLPIIRFSNILFHAGTAIVLFYILKRLINQNISFLSSLLFVIHPIAVEPVVWISAGIYPQSAFFLFLSFFMYIKHKDASIQHSNDSNNLSYIYYPLSSILFICSLLSSDKAIAYVLIFYSYEWFYGSIRKNWGRLLLLLCLSIAAFIIQSGRFTERIISSSLLNSNSLIISNYVSHITATIGMYMDRIFFPSWLSIYPSIINASRSTVIRWHIWTILLIGLFVYSVIRKKQFGFFISLFFISISFTLIPLPLASSYAERYVYFGYIGILICMILFIQQIIHVLNVYATKHLHNLQTNAYLRTLFYCLLITMYCLLIYRSYIRILDWKDTQTYILASYRDSPNNPKVRNLIAEKLIGEKRYNDAIKELETAINLAPNYLPAYHNLGVLNEENGDIEKAKYWYIESLARNPSQWQSAYQLGMIYKKEGNTPESEKYLQKAIEIQPSLRQVIDEQTNTTDNTK